MAHILDMLDYACQANCSGFSYFSMREKTVPFNLAVQPLTKAAYERFARLEDRKPGTVAALVLESALPQLLAAGSWVALREKWGQGQKLKVSQDVATHLHIALDILLETGADEKIKDIADKLTESADTWHKARATSG